MTESLTTVNFQITGTQPVRYQQILTPEAIQFVISLHERFNERRLSLLEKRILRQTEFDNGKLPDFPLNADAIRKSDWKVAPLPPDLLDRRVEITGPVDRKMIINALNSGAKVFMADFEDSNSPSWENNLEGQLNLRDAIRGTIEFTNPENGKIYRLNEKIATLLVRPRGWHLVEKHFLVEELPISGSLFDFGLYFFHNAQTLIQKGSGPYFYLPKLESAEEAKLWNDVFLFAQSSLGIPSGTIKATVLVETILATFELDEILYELREHSAGLNCGRWDYIFSYIKKFRNNPKFLLPDRSKVTMTTDFLRAYSRLVIKTCHKRGVHAMGGMAAQIPIKNDPVANEAAIERVKADKLREVQDGHDGTWVAHPGLVPVAMEIFNTYMPQPNQIEKQLPDFEPTRDLLLRAPEGTITEAGLRMNINVGILYIESWLRGVGAAAIYNLMEDAATAEISRTQVWQWIHHRAVMENGTTVTLNLCKRLMQEELLKIKTYVGEEAYLHGRFVEATAIFMELIESSKFQDFLTLSAYDRIN